MTNSYNKIKKVIDGSGTLERAKASKWFFKTGPGEYGEGDEFIGITVPVMRKIAKEFKDLPLSDLKKLLNSKIHEYKFTSLVILVSQYRKGDDKKKKQIANFYIANKKWVNNWDLVDSSALYILGDYLLSKDKDILYKLAKSKNLWDRRIAVLSTFRFIEENKFSDSFKIAEILLNDDHDLIHKAVGWMLREIGKRSIKVEIKFLEKHYKKMPRTMLRYSIEKFPEKKRQYFLKK